MEELGKVMIVGAGGFMGTVIRYGFYRAQNALWSAPFPIATLLVNMVGCFLMGAFSSWAEKIGAQNSPIFIFVSVGVLGGFTTFSAFGLDTFQLFKNGLTGLAAINILLQLVLGVSAVVLGRQAFGA